MTALTLIRTASLENATEGRSDLPNGERLYTIEPPWKDNAKGISCVPAGSYKLVPYESPEHGPTWYLENELLGVGDFDEARAYCELHSANWARQLEGCVAFGRYDKPMVDPATGKVEPAVEASRDAIAALLEALGPMTEGHTLTIVYAPGVAPAASAHEDAADLAAS